MTRTVLLPESKSMANRILVISSFLNQPLPEFATQANDVVDLSEALHALHESQTEFSVRDGGTTLRFLLTRLSRETGHFKIKASPRLLSRPHEDLFEVLRLLGARIETFHDRIEIIGNSWSSPGKTIILNCEKSTQFASALLLNSIQLPFDIRFQVENLSGSKPYLDMTVALLRQAGVHIDQSDSQISIAKNQEIKKIPTCEIDLSSAFSVAAVGVVKEGISIQNFPESSLQADSCFVSILKGMGVEISSQVKEVDNDHNSLLDIYFPKTLNQLKPICVDVSSSPDLFPVLAALCATVPARSDLTGVGSLQHKESDRLEKSIELLHLAGAQTERITDGLRVHGPINPLATFSFDPDHDHRMAMAAAVLKAAGVKIKILDPDVVNKSLIGFWEIVGITP